MDAIVVGEESRVLFLKWEKKVKFRTLSLINHHRVKVCQKLLVVEVFLNGQAEKQISF